DPRPHRTREQPRLAGEHAGHAGPPRASAGPGAEGRHPPAAARTGPAAALPGHLELARESVDDRDQREARLRDRLPRAGAAGPALALISPTRRRASRTPRPSRLGSMRREGAADDRAGEAPQEDATRATARAVHDRHRDPLAGD